MQSQVCSIGPKKKKNVTTKSGLQRKRRSHAVGEVQQLRSLRGRSQSPGTQNPPHRRVFHAVHMCDWTA